MVVTWFTRLRSWVQDAANGIGIRADYHDDEDNNFATGINQCLNIAGLNSPTSNINWGGFKITNATSGSAASDYATLAQAQTRVVAYAADSVGTDAYAITLSPALTAYAVGQQFIFNAGTANTGAATLNINGLGAKTIKKDKDADLNDGDIAQNQLVSVVYDGTNFQMLSPVHGQMNQTLSAIYAADGGGSDSYSISLTPTLPAYATGLMINFKANTANTGAASLNVNGLGAKTIKKDTSLDLETGDIKASQIVQVIYDGTNFQLISPKSYDLSQNCSAIYAADAQATDAYVVTLTPVPTAYTAGMLVNFKANTANTGASTLNVNSLGAIAIKKFGTTNDTATGDILAGQIVTAVYDGTNFQMISAVDDIANLTADTTPDSTADFCKTWDTSASTYKKVTPANFTLAGMPAGAVLQAVQGTLTTTATSSSTSFVDTGITASITPASSSNKILVIASVSLNSNAGTNNAAYLNIVRGSTDILKGDAASSRIRCTIAGGNANASYTSSNVITYLDSPATTSSTTYKIQYASSNAGAIYINRTAADTDAASIGRAASSIVLLEVKG